MRTQTVKRPDRISGSRSWNVPTVAVPALVAVALASWGAARLSLWWDEAITAGVALLGRRLISLAGGLLAGLLYASAPFVTWHAHEARPYATATALAVVATLISPRRGRSERGRG